MISHRVTAVSLAVILLGATLVGCAPGAEPRGGGVAAIYAEAGFDDPASESRVARDQAILEWAADEGLTEEFSVARLREDHDAEAEEAPRYGAQTLSIWNFYTEHVEAVAQQLRDRLRGALTADEVRAFYEQHPEEFARQDEITVRITEWSGQRAGAAHEITIDADTVRMLQEADDAAISAALDLEPGAQVSVERGDGDFALIECISRVDGGVEPFDEVMQAAAMRLATENFDAELRQRMRASGE